MSEKLWAQVDAYIADKLIPPDRDLAIALESSRAAGLPDIAVSPAQGKLLQLMARMMGARRILEIGTLGGYSTIWLARALPGGGRLVTLEYNPRHAEVARANLGRAGLAGTVEVVTGAALDTVKTLQGPFDFFFVDANKDGYPDYFREALKLARPGSVMVFDNVVRDGKVIDAKSSDALVQGVRRLHDAIAAEPRVSATTLQTVGVKGYDGLCVVAVNGD